MNELSEIDQVLLKQLKQKIEQRAGLVEDGDLHQKDFDFLLFYIQEKTGQALSLTTVKRIWRNEYQRLPHLSTLNMLALLADGKDWHTLKKELLEGQAPLQLDEGEIAPPFKTPVAAPTNQPRRSNGKRIFAVAAVCLLTLLLGLGWYFEPANQAGDAGAVQFSAVPTADGRIPNSVVFSYDVTGMKADHFYLQQSWDPARKVEISAAQTTQTDIYYEPGYHYAKLLVGDRVVREIPVHIQYRDWYVRFRYPNGALEKVNEADLHTQGHLGLKPDYLASRFHPLQDEFQLGYLLSRDFKLPADECQIQASVRFDSVHVPACPMFNVLIKGTGDYAWITLGNTGCESNLGLKVGNTYVDGKTNDLSLLGMDAFSWQRIGIKLSRGTFRIFINERVVREGRYSNSLGDLKELDFFFNGIGSLDEVSLEDGQHHSLLSQRF